ncbi:MAG: transposase [Rhodoplanes sp.]
MILDNHSAHISKETRAWLADQPPHRFAFVFTPKHGSWLNLIEETHPLRAAPHPRRLKAGTQDSSHGRHEPLQPTPRRSHVDL